MGWAKRWKEKYAATLRLTDREMRMKDAAPSD
jgi:hypothetical protein